MRLQVKMIKRTSKKYVEGLLNKNPDWKIVDLGGGSNAWSQANTILDIKDHSSLYPGKRFVQSDASKTPFEDKEFDFVIASHVTEHVDDMEVYMSELMRIGKRGYIEVPTPLFDNLVFGNFEEHKWWLYFDDITSELLYTKKKTKLLEAWYPSQLKNLEPYFLDQMQMSFLWEDSIEYRKINQEDTDDPPTRIRAVAKNRTKQKNQVVFTNDGTGKLRKI